MTQDFTIFFSSDIHGSEKCWMKFVNAAKFYGAQALVMGGDITGKAIVPIVCDGQGNYTMEFLGKASHLTQKDLPEAEKRVRLNGFYPYICDAREVERLEQNPGHLGLRGGVPVSAPKGNCLRSFAHWLLSCDQTYRLSSTCIRRHIAQGLMRHLNCARTSRL